MVDTMFASFQTRTRPLWIPMFAAMAGACGMSASQDFSLGVADDNPLGIGNFVPTSLQVLEDSGGIESGIKGAFGAALAMDTVYNSNFFLAENDPQSELSLNLNPSLGYTSDPEGGATWALTANYLPAYRAFLNNSDLNDIDQSGNVQLAFQGARTTASIFASYRQLSGSDRLTGDFVSGSLFTGGILASREIATRTSIKGGITYAQSDYSSGVIEGSDSFSTYLGVLWSASDRTSVGLNVRYSRSESNNTGSRDAWALLGQLRYRVGERVWLSASLGPKFSTDSESGDSTLRLSGDISSRYVINERWSWVSSLRSSTIPSPSDQGYIVNNYGFNTSLEHQLLRATLSGGFYFNFTEYEEVGTTNAVRDNQENLGLFLSYSRKLFSDRVSVDTSVSYSTSSGGREWSKWLISMGLSMPF